MSSVLHETTTGLEGRSRDRGYSLMRTYGFTFGKVRIVVDWDSYDFQTRLYSEVWTDKGWTRVVVISGQDPQWGHATMTSGYVQDPGATLKRKSLEAVAQELLERTIQVLS